MIEAHGSADENAALIAEHLEAAGDLHAAYEWHMRAGTWSNLRDDAAAMTSWRRARRVADLLPETDPDRATMRIAPRTLLCATATRTLGSGAETGFEELRDLCIAAGDQRSLAIATAGHALDQYFKGRLTEASQLGTELVRLLESTGDPTLTLALLGVPLSAKQQTGEMSEVLRLAERGIELAGGDSTKGKMMTGSPLTLIVALRGMARCCLGIAGWRDDFERAVSMGRTAEPITRSAALYFTYVAAIANAILSPTVAVLCEAEEALTFAEQSGGDVAVGQGIQYLGILLVRLGGSSRAKGFQLLDRVRTMALEQRYNAAVVPLTDILLAEERMRIGDVAGAIWLSRPAVNEFFVAGDVMWAGYGTNVLVEALLRRKISADLENAKVAVDRLAATQVEPDFVVHRIWLLRAQALLARAYGDNAAYQDHRDRYRKMANELGFEGHITMAEAMP